jgi:serine protease Do
MSGGLAWAAVALGALNPDLSGWVKARAQAYDGYLKAVHVVTPGQLWHERPANEPVAPNFVGPTSLAPLIRAVSRSVVNIKGSAPEDSSGIAPPGVRPQQVGSGFIIRNDGFVITNNHVVEGTEEIRVRLSDGRDFAATVVGRDASTDVALLKVDTDRTDLPFAYLGDSDQMDVGDWVLAIGNPFELDHTASHGIISAKERQLGIGMFDDFIQTDALINPGNSGGPLFNMHGEVVGVNTARQGQGIGFAIPINMVKDLIPNLSMNGRLARGWLGLKLQEIAGAEGEHRGALVYFVFDNGPAAGAGVQTGDHVVAVNGRPFESYLELQRRVAFLPPGSEVKLTLTRDGGTRETTVTLVERHADEAGDGADSRWGPLGVVVLPSADGVLIGSVAEGGPAERAGLKAGDVILELNRVKVPDVKSYRDALERRTAGGKLLVFFQRGDARRYVTVTLE